MANVTVFRTNPVYQAPGQAAWNFAEGDRDNFWGFSARPYQSNNTVQLLYVAANTGNGIDLVSTDVVIKVVQYNPQIVGGLVRFTAVKVS